MRPASYNNVTRTAWGLLVTVDVTSIGVYLDHMHLDRRLEPAQLWEKAFSDESLGFLCHMFKAAGTWLRHVVHWGCAIVCWPLLHPGKDVDEVHLVTRPADSSWSGNLSSLAQ